MSLLCGALAAIYAGQSAKWLPSPINPNATAELHAGCVWKVARQRTGAAYSFGKVLRGFPNKALLLMIQTLHNTLYITVRCEYIVFGMPITQCRICIIMQTLLELSGPRFGFGHAVYRQSSTKTYSVCVTP